jgi:hypothetical protein
MPAYMENSPILCPDCGALILKDYCSICGYHPLQDKKTEDNVDPDSDQTPEVVEKTESVEKISIFDTSLLGNRDSSSEKKTRKKSKKGSFAFISLLFLLLIGVSAYYYWLYQSTVSTFLSPLPDFDIANAEDGLTMDTSSDSEEIVLDYKIDIAEGNFQQQNFAQFAGPEITIYTQMFNTFEFLKKFQEEETVNKLLKDLELEEDDMKVYLSSGFAVIIPDDNFDRWGYTVGVIDKKYAEGKIAALEKLKVKKGNEMYKDIYARVITFKVEEPAVDEDKDSDSKDEVKDDDKDAAKDAAADDKAAETSTEVHYLIVSNSKEYMDQMKEMSEGVLPNLANSALFAQAQKALPTVGNALIFHNKKVAFSNDYYQWFASKFDYEGLDKVLEAIRSSAIVLYSQSERLKIAGLSDL